MPAERDKKKPYANIKLNNTRKEISSTITCPGRLAGTLPVFWFFRFQEEMRAPFSAHWEKWKLLHMLPKTYTQSCWRSSGHRFSGPGWWWGFFSSFRAERLPRRYFRRDKRRTCSHSEANPWVPFRSVLFCSFRLVFWIQGDLNKFVDFKCKWFLGRLRIVWDMLFLRVNASAWEGFPPLV